jgi:hypothetical protein
LVTELLTSAKQVDAEIAPAVVNALAVVTESAGKNMGASVKEGLKELVEDADSTPGKPSTVEIKRVTVISFDFAIVAGPYATAIRKLKQALSGETRAVQPEGASYVEE